MKVEKDANDWIDLAIARRLMLEYQQVIGITGGSEIERRIAVHTKLGLHRKTIENWLRDSDSIPSPQTIKIILRFLCTAHCQKIVPRTRDHLESDARLHRVGIALFNLYGAAGMHLIIHLTSADSYLGFQLRAVADELPGNITWLD